MDFVSICTPGNRRPPPPRYDCSTMASRSLFFDETFIPIDGVFFDGVNTAYQGPSYAPWGRRATNVPNCSARGGAGCEALIAGALDLARRVTIALNAAGKVPMFSNVGWFAKPPGVPPSLWMDEKRCAH